MRTVTVGVAGRTELARVDRAGGLGAFDEPADTNKFVVAVARVESLAGLTATVPVFGCIEFDNVGFVVEAAAQPLAEQCRRRPLAFAETRPVGPARVLQGRVFRRNAAVDDTDNEPFAIEPLCAAETGVAIEQFEKVETADGSQRTDFVLPDTGDLRLRSEFLGLRGVHDRRESVETVFVAVDALDARARFCENGQLLVFELRGVRAHRGAVLLQPRRPRSARRKFVRRRGLLTESCVILARGRRVQLHNVDFKRCVVVGAGQGHIAAAANGRLGLYDRYGREQRQYTC